jgi:hypothetical protein
VPLNRYDICSWAASPLSSLTATGWSPSTGAAHVSLPPQAFPLMWIGAPRRLIWAPLDLYEGSSTWWISRSQTPSCGSTTLGRVCSIAPRRNCITVERIEPPISWLVAAAEDGDTDYGLEQRRARSSRRREEAELGVGRGQRKATARPPAGADVGKRQSLALAKVNGKATD